LRREQIGDAGFLILLRRLTREQIGDAGFLILLRR